MLFFRLADSTNHRNKMNDFTRALTGCNSCVRISDYLLFGRIGLQEDNRELLEKFWCSHSRQPLSLTELLVFKCTRSEEFGSQTQSPEVAEASV